MPYSTACGGSSSIDVLAWGPGQGLLAAAAPDGSTSLLSETVLHRLLRADVGVIQLSTDSVRVERQNGASVLLTTDISIRGLAVSSRHVRNQCWVDIHIQHFKGSPSLPGRSVEWPRSTRL